MAVNHNYTPPVSELLTYGTCHANREWPNYVEELDFTLEDVPELVRLGLDVAFDDLTLDDPEMWAPIHAWRVLGQLRAETAIEPLIALLGRDDDWVGEELLAVFSLMGGAAIPGLKAFFLRSKGETWVRIRALESLEAIIKRDPSYKVDCVPFFQEQLANFANQELDINAALISILIEGQVVEAAPLIEQAYQADAVDQFWCGSWASVQIDLGLKSEADFTEAELRPSFSPEVMDLLDNLRRGLNLQPKGFGQLLPTKSSKKTTQGFSKKKKKR
jgi:hypothetical protein